MALKKTKNTTIGGSALYNPWCRCQPARRAQRVNDEPVKVLDLLFFVYFIWKWGETLEKLHFFTFGPKQCFYLTHSVREYFEKLALKKMTGRITYKHFQKVHSIFFKTGLFFARSTHVGTRQGGSAPYNTRFRCQRLAALKELTHFSQVSHFYTPWKRRKTFGFLTFSGGGV